MSPQVAAAVFGNNGGGMFGRDFTGWESRFSKTPKENASRCGDSAAMILLPVKTSWSLGLCNWKNLCVFPYSPCWWDIEPSQSLLFLQFYIKKLIGIKGSHT